MVSPFFPPVTIDCVVDVSHHQGLVDFPALYREGVRAVFIKASQGLSFHDPMYMHNEQAALDAGLLVAPYHFIDDEDPVEQVKNLSSAAGLRAGMVVMLDWEPDSDHTADADTVAEVGKGVMQITGRAPLLYTGRFQLQAPHPVLSTWPLMLAEYGNEPICPPGWGAWLFHQYTNQGRVHGVHGNVDRSVFAGTEEDLVAWWHEAVVHQEPVHVDPPPLPEPVKPPTIVAEIKEELKDAKTVLTEVEHKVEHIERELTDE